MTETTEMIEPKKEATINNNDIMISDTEFLSVKLEHLSSADAKKRVHEHDEGDAHDNQKAALEKAKNFARDMQAVLLKSAGKNSTPPPIPSILLSSNPGLASGIDPRSLSVLSRIYVGSINFELTEQHLRVVFGQFGAIKSVSMSLDPITGKHKGFCFIEFETPEGASLALDSMNGAELGGRQLKVGRPNNYTAATAAG
ncbi:5158_t:CDS:2 [Ambispora gerdemannii]|uniref:5158_t:CDS:1 n=1 Tax=Ambispora gerdemannii TaxID=144530 RepID=A0A9N8VRZ1_9GLOM|nr:5158_t:CDS:2 [Ambispora gerdemannii]